MTDSEVGALEPQAGIFHPSFKLSTFRHLVCTYESQVGTYEPQVHDGIENALSCVNSLVTWNRPCNFPVDQI